MEAKIIDVMRKAFEEISCPSFGHELLYPRNEKGEYVNPVLEDHWQSFQEGWESATKLMQQSKNNYSDIISDGGKDSRR